MKIKKANRKKLICVLVVLLIILLAVAVFVGDKNSGSNPGNEEITLGDDEYFVMGDNRNDSKDSRFEEVGNIHRDEFEGKAAIRIWPLSKFGGIE